MSKYREFSVKITFFNGEQEVYNGVQYHKFYDNTVRLIRHPKHSFDIFIPMKNVKSLSYVGAV